MVHPPRAPLVLRVGITGHRPDTQKRPDPNVDQLRKTAHQILQHIADTFAGVAANSETTFDCPPDPQRGGRRGTLRAISALAAGADQWFADEALKLGYELQCPLPFQRDEYLKDFASDEPSRRQFEKLLGEATAVLELDGRVGTTQRPTSRDSQSYEAVGRVMLDQSDLLIALWDGQQSRGQGGTGQIVAEARQRGIPIIWIPWADTAQEKLVDPCWRLLDGPENMADDYERLTKQIKRLLTPPENVADEHLGNPAICEMSISASDRRQAIHYSAGGCYFATYYAATHLAA